MTQPKLGKLPDAPLGVAVSGGGDSVALLMLLHTAGHQIQVATVNHQLRPEAAAEAAGVALLCAKLGVEHQILVWESPDKLQNLQNAARDARRALLTKWAVSRGLENIALGHTLDDQAETVLMRLARGSGVDGLAGMAAHSRSGKIRWHRPLLDIRRAALREYLQKIDVTWIDDPSNDDLKYDRVQARKALKILAPLGVTSAGLTKTATHMARARVALEITTQQLATECVTVTDAGEVRIGLDKFANAPHEIQLRLLASSLRWVVFADYRPRFTALSGLLKACLSHENFGKTLHGCTIKPKNNEIVINREVSATPPQSDIKNTWDKRWQIAMPEQQNCQIRALGEDGLPNCPDWRASGHSRASLLASPSLWCKQVLIAAPFANFGDKWRVNLAGGKKGFYDQLVTH